MSETLPCQKCGGLAACWCDQSYPIPPHAAGEHLPIPPAVKELVDWYDDASTRIGEWSVLANLISAVVVESTKPPAASQAAPEPEIVRRTVAYVRTLLGSEADEPGWTYKETVILWLADRIVELEREREAIRRFLAGERVALAGVDNMLTSNEDNT